jgi:hypothetical protein
MNADSGASKRVHKVIVKQRVEQVCLVTAALFLKPDADCVRIVEMKAANITG